MISRQVKQKDLQITNETTKTDAIHSSTVNTNKTNKTNKNYKQTNENKKKTNRK